MGDASRPRPTREPSYADALTPLIVLVVLIGSAVSMFGLEATEGPMQMALLLSAMTAALIALKNGHAWETIADAGRRGISSVVSAIFILLAVGALIGSWNMSGTIPTLVYYGIQFIDPISAPICARRCGPRFRHSVSRRSFLRRSDGPTKAAARARRSSRRS